MIRSSELLLNLIFLFSILSFILSYNNNKKDIKVGLVVLSIHVDEIY